MQIIYLFIFTLDSHIVIKHFFDPESFFFLNVDEIFFRVRSLALNIKNDNNPELRERIWFGDLTPEHLSTVDLAELASSSMKKWREEMVRKAEENTIVKK